MSEYAASTRSSRVSSILKTPSIRSRLSAAKSTSKVRFELRLAKTLRRILREYLKNENLCNYENLLISIRDAELLDSDVSELLAEATQCISLLNEDLRLFVQAILSIKWAHRCSKVISEFQSFLLNLLTAHNYHAQYAIEKLVANFIPDCTDEWVDGIPSDEDQKCASVHGVFNILLKIMPMCQELLLISFQQQYPYYKRPTHIHEYFLHNLLWMLDYQPHLRHDILTLIFARLIILDVAVTKRQIEEAENGDICDETIFAMDIDQIADASRLRDPQAHTLDVCIDKLFNYLIVTCHNCDTGEVDWNNVKSLYQDMIVIFDKSILTSYNLHHVQFVIFMLCSFKLAIAEAFLNYLWKKVCTPSTPSVMRQSAVAYIASFIARASKVSLSMLKGTLQQMAEWVHSYISAQDEVECINTDVRIHTVFYSVCQAIFYVIAFRQSDLVRTKKNISFLESLNLPKMVTCRFNPLRVCQPAVVQNFAAVTRTYQLAYCYSVIEHNARNTMTTMYEDVSVSHNPLDSFFPFDLYVLKRSGERLSPFYLNYNNSVHESSYPSTQEFEDDDFLCDQETSSKGIDKFSYGSSPGFRRKH